MTKNDIPQKEYFNLILKFKQSNAQYILYRDNFLLDNRWVTFDKPMTN